MREGEREREMKCSFVCYAVILPMTFIVHVHVQYTEEI